MSKLLVSDELWNLVEPILPKHRVRYLNRIFFSDVPGWHTGGHEQITTSGSRGVAPDHRRTAAKRPYRGSLLSRSRNQRQRFLFLETATAFTGEVESFVSAGVRRGNASECWDGWNYRDLPAR